MGLKLWYTTEAKSFSEALPFGNGSLGGMVYGGVPKEKITLNHDTLWSGNGLRPEKDVPYEHLEYVREKIFKSEYAVAEKFIEENMLGYFNESYMPMGELTYHFLNIGKIQNYKRTLDLERAIIETQFEVESTLIKSSVFSSYIDNAIIIKIVSAKERKLNIEIAFSSLLKNTLELDNNNIMMKGETPSHVIPIYIESDNAVQYDDTEKGILFESVVNIECVSGKCKAQNDKLVITDATEVIIKLVHVNGYQGFRQKLISSVEEINKKCKEKLKKIIKKTYVELEKRHIEDYQRLYKRVDFSLEDDIKIDKPTDIRLEEIKNGNKDLNFYSMYFQYGRYLMISSSRGDSQPANLQGIWNDELRPAWSSNYTVNINTEMNYWMTLSANLEECYRPLVQMVKELSQQGKVTAENQYHCKGWVSNHNVDLWRQTSAVGGNPKYAYWPMSGIWLTAHLYEFYRYTQNSDYLYNTAYPIMKSAAEFCLDWLVKGPDGKLHTCPSTSPENTFLTAEGEECSVSYSSTMDISLIKELFINIIRINETFNNDNDFVQLIKKAYKQLPKFQITSDGCLQEWIEDFEEAEPSHRHFSPIYGFFPGNIINENESPELEAACQKYIERKLSKKNDHIGWSCAWLINLYAKFKNDEKAYKFLQHLIQDSTYKNLFDLHPPLNEGFEGEKEVFQIDGNFGGAAGIISMLLQSSEEQIEIFPALPKEWHSGKLKGVKAVGGFEVDIEWENNNIKKVLLRSLAGKTARIKYKKDLCVMCSEKRVKVQHNDKGQIQFDTVKGECYIITVIDCK